jgi:integrase
MRGCGRCLSKSRDFQVLFPRLPGPVFRKVDRWGRVHVGRLDPDAVRQILKKRAAQANISGTIWEPITPHGMRAGFITAAYKNGVPDEEIMGHTRHRSVATMRGYVRRAKLGTTSPAGHLRRCVHDVLTLNASWHGKKVKSTRPRSVRPALLISHRQCRR